MSLPGFDAARSVYRSTQTYRPYHWFGTTQPARASMILATPTDSCGPCQADQTSPTGCSKECSRGGELLEIPCHPCAGGCFACAPGQSCCYGPGMVCCGTACTNVNSDSQNCSSCGHKCPAGPPNSTPTCTNGQCGFACNAGFSQCGNSCVLLDNDVNNCGSCGHKCPTGMGCTYGFCESVTRQCDSPQCDPNTNRCFTKCCVKTSGECTGLYGPRRCIMPAGAATGTTPVCCITGPLWGQRPWALTSCNDGSPDSAGCEPCL